jgi:hypothetical protein
MCVPRQLVRSYGWYGSRGEGDGRGDLRGVRVHALRAAAGEAGEAGEQVTERVLVLALGEVTGHAHAVAGPGRLIREAGVFGPMLLHVPEGARVVHEEHAAITLPKGWYRVIRQREYVPGSVRVVAD